MDEEAEAPDPDDEIILLDSPVIDADELIEPVDENDVETEQIVLLDVRRLDDLELA